MPQDAYTLKHLCRELNGVFAGGKINKIVQPENERVVFTVYTGMRTHKLILDVRPSCPRIGITEEEPVSLLTAPNFCMLLRKHLSGATVNCIELVGFDRVVRITCTGGGEFSQDEKTLYVELMGRYSNIILTEKGKILGGNRGINFFDNGVRPLIVGLPYVYPPTGGKKTPDDLSLKAYFNAFNGDNLAEYITAGVQGVAKQTAEEAVFCFDGEYCGEKFFNHLKNFLYSENANPCVSVDLGKVKEVYVYPYKCVKGEFKFFPTLYAAEDFYFRNKDNDRLFQSKKNELLYSVNASLKKYGKKLSAVTQREKEAENADDFKIKGELILANIYRVKRGEKTLSATNYYDGSEQIIPLDENLSPSQNAENYYKKYAKLKRTLENVVPQKAKITEEIDYLTAVKDEIDLAESIFDVEMVKSELNSVGLLKDKVKTVKKKPEKTMRRYLINGFTVSAGRNNVENDELILSAKKTDIWLHAKNFHSSHVIISCENRSPDIKTITLAAEICAYYSKAREGGKTEIVYTQRKNVKKPNGAKLGFCFYEDYSTLVVLPQKHDELIKKE